MIRHRNARNPVLPLGHHMGDCEARVMPDGQLYLYGSHDTSESRYCSAEYHVASTPDMAHWTVHDVSFHADQAEWAQATAAQGRSFLDGANSYEDLPEYVRQRLSPDVLATPFGEFAAAVRRCTNQQQPSTPHLYAPDVIEKHGKYYLYLCLSDDSEGVAVADRPEGPFADAIRLPVSGIDPAVFIDDDGQGYYYWGQFAANGAHLNDDMLSIDESSIVTGLVTEQQHHFHEGSSLRKRSGTYYLVFADISRGRPTCLGYATATAPLGPFIYRGIIIDNDGCDPRTWNNHGSIEQFRGQWYVFYHRSSRMVPSMRRVCVEPITFAADGSIPEVKMTSQGAGEPFGPGEPIPAFTSCGLAGTAHLAPFGGTEAIVAIGDGDAAIFRHVQSDHGLRSMQFTATGSGAFEILADDQHAGTADITRGECPVHIAPGVHELRLVFRQPQQCRFIGMSLE